MEITLKELSNNTHDVGFTVVSLFGKHDLVISLFARFLFAYWLCSMHMFVDKYLGHNYNYVIKKEWFHEKIYRAKLKTNLTLSAFRHQHKLFTDNSFYFGYNKRLSDLRKPWQLWSLGRRKTEDVNLMSGSRTCPPLNFTNTIYRLTMTSIPK